MKSHLWGCLKVAYVVEVSFLRYMHIYFMNSNDTTSGPVTDDRFLLSPDSTKVRIWFLAQINKLIQAGKAFLPDLN